jgi:hypothetical protein
MGWGRFLLQPFELRPGRAIVRVDLKHAPESVYLFLRLGEGIAQHVPGTFVARLASYEPGQRFGSFLGSLGVQELQGFIQGLGRR